MSKKDFIALADAIREANSHGHDTNGHYFFGPLQIALLCDFCQSQNSRFNRERWLSYIAGECGPNGGKVKAA